MVGFGGNFRGGQGFTRSHLNLNTGGLASAPDARQAAVDSWNANNAVGCGVSYRNDKGDLTVTTTRTEASILSGHTAVIWLNGVAGCVLLDRVKPV